MLPPGTLMKKIQRQPSHEVTSPPTVNPVKPPTEPCSRPKARRRAWRTRPSGNVADSNDNTAGDASAAKNP